MAASFQVNQPPADFTINIGLTFHNGTVTVQPQVVPTQLPPQMPQPHQQRLQQAQQTQPLAAINELVRGLNSLSIQRQGPHDEPSHSLASIDSQEPPAQLNQAKRRERAAQRPQPQPVGIPNVPDTDSPRSLRRERRAAAERSASSGVGALIVKAPPGAVPGNSMGKCMRPSPVQPEFGDECEQEMSDAILSELLGETDNGRRRRQPSSVVAADSPGASSHASSSPPNSYASFPTPPYTGAGSAAPPSVPPALSPAVPPAEQQRRRRGRPPKVRTDGGASAPVRAPRTVPARVVGDATSPQLQPRPTLHAGAACGTAICGVGGADFVSPANLAEAVKVISRYTDAELATPNEMGELLSLTFAKERNWPKLMALNWRWLSSPSLGNIFTSINTPSGMGHTPIIEAVLQQDLKAFEYCCMFTSSSDVQLFRALVESALLPSDAIFADILRAMCHDVDENGNPIKRASRFIDEPIQGWSFRNQELGNYAGLTLAQMLTLLPANTHPRLATLIGCGADPRRSIDSRAAEKYRPLIDCVCLATVHSPAPYECLVALGMILGGGRFASHFDGEWLNWCIATICGREDLNPSYLDQVRQKHCPMPELSYDDVKFLDLCHAQQG